MFLDWRVTFGASLPQPLALIYSSKTYTNRNKVSSDDNRRLRDGWIGRARLPCLICKGCVNKVITVLGQLRNICSAFCIAWSPWEQWAAWDKKSQGVRKTTKPVWCSIPVKHPGSGPRLQGLSTVSIHTNPNYCTVTLVSTEQLSHSLALRSRFGPVSKNFSLLRLWNKMQILYYVKKKGREGPGAVVANSMVHPHSESCL